MSVTEIQELANSLSDAAETLNAVAAEMLATSTAELPLAAEMIDQNVLAIKKLVTHAKEALKGGM